MAYPSLLDPSLADVRVELGMAEAEYARIQLNTAHATLVASVHSVVAEARLSPDVYVGPHADPANRDHVEFAERAAIADLAVRLALTENTIRSYVQQAATLQARTPLVWAAFRDGRISPQNARTTAEFAASLPDDPATSHAYDDQVRDAATLLNPARFRTRARVLRERLVASTADERHRSERDKRRVELEPAVDGMCWLTAYLPAEMGVAAMAALDAFARAEVADGRQSGATLDQLRADRFGELLTGAASGSPVGVRVGLLVPVLLLLGADDAPATLEGYGPIDIDTARRMTACAPSFFRVLTDPIEGTVLDIDATTLRVPADMRRWLEVVDQVCTFPGCGRKAKGCDLDHTVDRQFGGITRVCNLAHLCRKHHRIKHQTEWKVEQNARREITWTSPTGHVTRANPPPF